MQVVKHKYVLVYVPNPHSLLHCTALPLLGTTIIDQKSVSISFTLQPAAAAAVFMGLFWYKCCSELSGVCEMRPEVSLHTHLT